MVVERGLCVGRGEGLWEVRARGVASRAATPCAALSELLKPRTHATCCSDTRLCVCAPHVFCLKSSYTSMCVGW